MITILEYKGVPITQRHNAFYVFGFACQTLKEAKEIIDMKLEIAA
jgi:hypothetical protein